MFVMYVSTWVPSYMFARFDCQKQYQDVSATSTAPLSTLCVEEVELRTLVDAQPTRSALDTIR